MTERTQYRPLEPFVSRDQYVKLAKKKAQATGSSWESAWEAVTGNVDWNTVPLMNLSDFKGKIELLSDETSSIFLNSTFDIEDPNSLIMSMRFAPSRSASWVTTGSHAGIYRSFDALWQPLFANGLVDVETIALASRYEEQPKKFEDVLALLNKDYPGENGDNRFTKASQVLDFQHEINQLPAYKHKLLPIDFAADWVPVALQQLQQLHPAIRRSFEIQHSLPILSSDLRNLELYFQAPRLDWRTFTFPKLDEIVGELAIIAGSRKK